MMEHFYQRIDGWFDFQDVYSSQVETAKDGAHFVEIGAWLGKSTAYMGVEILNSGKRIRFDVVDTWAGSEGELDTWHSLAKKEDIFHLFMKNTQPISAIIHPVRNNSTEAAKLYPDESIDFIFIDANHSYEFVKADIAAWYPKLKKGAYIGGHDYNWETVKRAVDEYFKDRVQSTGISWLYRNV
jgi:hypothetical protein